VIRRGKPSGGGSAMSALDQIKKMLKGHEDRDISLVNAKAL
jgi:hypothetical protein